MKNQLFFLVVLSLVTASSLGCGGTTSNPVDTGTTDAGSDDAATGTDASGSDAATGDDGGGTSACPCFGTNEIATIEAHATAGGTRGCMTGVSSGTSVSGALSSTEGAQNLQVDVQELGGVAGTQWTCGTGCSDLNDDTVDDCADAPLPHYASMVVSEAQHDTCEALIAAACE